MSKRRWIRANSGPAEPSRTSFARKFELLLEMFPFPDREQASNKEGRKWRNSELEQASGFRLSGSYLSSLRRGMIEDPGLTKLDLIARIMGFPTELWVLEPKEWGKRLEHNTRRGLRPESLVDSQFAGKLQEALRRGRTAISGEDATPYELARRSGGRLSGEDIDAMIEGELLPNLTQLLVVSDGLGYDLYAWGGMGRNALEGGGSTAEPPSFNGQVIAKESQSLDDYELEVTLQFVRQLRELRARREGRNSAPPLKGEDKVDEIEKVEERNDT